VKKIMATQKILVTNIIGKCQLNDNMFEINADFTPEGSETTAKEMIRYIDKKTWESISKNGCYMAKA